jgi:alpha-L-fucosidase
LLEWENPTYLANASAYVQDYMTVQLKDLVNRFEPDILWTDGHWDHTADFWKSKEFLAWLYTNSTVKDKVVVNGRWGNDMDRKKGPFVGNFMALEFDGGDDNLTYRAWEECRGIGISFGFNSNERSTDINSLQVLLLTLVDRVA